MPRASGKKAKDCSKDLLLINNSQAPDITFRLGSGFLVSQGRGIAIAPLAILNCVQLAKFFAATPTFPALQLPLPPLPTCSSLEGGGIHALENGKKKWVPNPQPLLLAGEEGEEVKKKNKKKFTVLIGTNYFWIADVTESCFKVHTGAQRLGRTRTEKNKPMKSGSFDASLR